MQPIFNNFAFNLDQITVAFGGQTTTGGNQAFTVGNSVILNREVWQGLDPVAQRELLAHEITHSVQYRELGKARFLARYAKEFPKYGVPPDLAKIPISKLNPVHSGFSLDQIADRVAAEYMVSP